MKMDDLGYHHFRKPPYYMIGILWYSFPSCHGEEPTDLPCLRTVGSSQLEVLMSVSGRCPEGKDLSSDSSLDCVTHVAGFILFTGCTCRYLQWIMILL